MSKELIMLLVIGGGIILPILFIVTVIVIVTSKNERQFHESDITDEAIKNYICDQNNRRQFSDNDRRKLLTKKKRWLLREVFLYVVVVVLEIIAFLFASDKGMTRNVVIMYIIVNIVFIIPILYYGIKLICNTHKAKQISDGWIIKAYVYKYIRIPGGRHYRDNSRVLVVFFNYINMKYETFETVNSNIEKKEVDENNKAEYIELICEEKNDSLQVFDVLS